MYAIEKLDPKYEPDQALDVFDNAAYIVRRTRPWFRRQRDKYPLHPVVIAAMKLCRPYDWQQLLLEWPHRSDNDANIVAFTRDERGGEADRVVTTSMGKYLGRHFPLPDHYVRDLVALHTLGQEQIKFVHTIDEMLHHLNNGPHSCMRKPNEDPARHPYRAYDPEYGWHMAVRIEQDGMTCGRALCYEDPKTKEKFFVRSYNRDRSGGYSHSDNKLEAWLKQQGYEHRNSWCGCKLKWIANDNLFLAPYLDGDTHYVSEEFDSDKQCHYLLVVDSESEAQWILNNTCGEPSEVNPGTPCEDCSDHVPDGDGYWVGRREDRLVCYSCRDNDYTWAYTRNGYRAYIHNDDVVYVESMDEHYDADYLSDNSIVCLENGDYEHVDNAIEVDGDWYAADSDEIVQLADGEYARIDNCVEIRGAGWYSKDDDDIVQIDGDWYLKEDDAVVECDDGEYRLKDDCFQCPACDAWHARELIEA